MTLPIGIEDEFKGVVDLLTRKAWVWDDSGDPTATRSSMSRPTWSDKVEEYRETAGGNGARAGRRPAGGISRRQRAHASKTSRRCIRKGTIELDFFPTYCGSAFKNKGMQLVLNAVVDYLPNPTEVDPQPEIDLEGNETGGKFAIVDPAKPLRALAFKIMDDRYGALTFTRIYSGQNQAKAIPSSTPSPARPNALAASWKCTPTRARSSTRRRRATSLRCWA